MVKTSLQDSPKKLLELGKISDLTKATDDKTFRKQLYSLYGIE